MSVEFAFTADVAQRITDGTLREHVVSHAGRSQYSRIGGGVSACGLAALNCARVVFEIERAGSKGIHILNELMKRETLEDVLRPCLSWSSPAHLDVDEIHKAPIFHKTLKLLSSDYDQSGFVQFKKVLSRLKGLTRTTEASTCAIITRPPEIIACINIASRGSDIFVIFDSHPRPEKHPQGAAFIFLSSLEGAAAYLADLLKYDARLLMDSTLQWQAQLLAHFSAHYFKPYNALYSPAEFTEAILQTSLEVLSLRARVMDLENQNKGLGTENDRLLDDVARLEVEVAELKEISRREQPSTRRFRGVDDQAFVNASARALGSVDDVKYKSVKGKEPQRPSSNKTFSATEARTGPTAVQKNAASGSRYAGNEFPGRIRDEGSASATALEYASDPATNRDNTFAALMQRHYDEEDARLQHQMQNLKHTVPEVFECGVCLDTFNEDVVARVEGCGHQFCRACMLSHVVTKIEERRYPIMCPLCMAEKDPRDVDAALIEQLGLSEKQYENFIEMQMAAFSIVLHCRKCKNSVFVVRKEYEATDILVCPLQGCNHAWCKTCSQKIQIGGPKHSCDGSSELNHLMRQRGWKYCPGCQTPAEKIDGCNHMTCMSPGCNTHFCYLCGDAIVQTVRRQGIRSAVTTHYQRCRLFEDVA